MKGVKRERRGLEGVRVVEREGGKEREREREGGREGGHSALPLYCTTAQISSMIIHILHILPQNVLALHNDRSFLQIIFCPTVSDETHRICLSMTQLSLNLSTMWKSECCF